MSLKNQITICVLAVALCRCASPLHVADANGDPTTQLNHLYLDLNAAREAQFDLLDADDFNLALSLAQTAKAQIAEDRPAAVVTTTLDKARAAVARARQQAQTLQDAAQPVLNARSAALRAGIKDLPGGAAGLQRQDSAFRSLLPEVSSGKRGGPVRLMLVRGYWDLELRGLRGHKLAVVDLMIDEARKDGAEDRTPETLAQAESEQADADYIIANDPHNETVMNHVVADARESAQFLRQVLAASNSSSGRLSEPAAIAQVRGGEHTQQAVLKSKGPVIREQ